jgi:hypothetical protein
MNECLKEIREIVDDATHLTAFFISSRQYQKPYKPIQEEQGIRILLDRLVAKGAFYKEIIPEIISLADSTTVGDYDKAVSLINDIVVDKLIIKATTSCRK